MSILEFAQKHYFHELDRRHQITSSVSLPVGILVLLIGAVLYFASTYPYADDTITYVFVALLGCSLIAIVYTIVFLLRSYWSYVYQYLPPTDEFLSYHARLLEYNQAVAPKKAVNATLAEFESILAARYSQAATINASNNNRKSATLHKANTGLVALLVSVTLSAPFFYWRHLNHPTLPSTTSIEVNMSAPDNSKKGSQDKKPDPKPKPEKPQPPKNVNLRESDEGKTKGKRPFND